MSHKSRYPGGQGQSAPRGNFTKAGGGNYQRGHSSSYQRGFERGEASGAFQPTERRAQQSKNSSFSERPAITWSWQSQNWSDQKEWTNREWPDDDHRGTGR